MQRALNRIEDPPIFLVARDGFYPKIGKLTTGSGPTLGVGYRNRTVLDRYGILDGWIAGSIETYWGIEGRITFPELARGRLLAEGLATLREYPREAYFGLGPDSRRSDRSAFLLKSSRVGGRAGVRLAPFVLVGAGLTTINRASVPAKRTASRRPRNCSRPKPPRESTPTSTTWSRPGSSKSTTGDR